MCGSRSQLGPPVCLGRGLFGSSNKSRQAEQVDLIRFLLRRIQHEYVIHLGCFGETGQDGRPFGIQAVGGLRSSAGGGKIRLLMAHFFC